MYGESFRALHETGCLLPSRGNNARFETLDSYKNSISVNESKSASMLAFTNRWSRHSKSQVYLISRFLLLQQDHQQNVCREHNQTRLKQWILKFGLEKYLKILEVGNCRDWLQRTLTFVLNFLSYSTLSKLYPIFLYHWKDILSSLKQPVLVPKCDGTAWLVVSLRGLKVDLHVQYSHMKMAVTPIPFARLLVPSVMARKDRLTYTYILKFFSVTSRVSVVANIPL